MSIFNKQKTEAMQDKVVLLQLKDKKDFDKATYLFKDVLGLNIYPQATNVEESSVAAGDKYTVGYKTDFVLLCWKNDYAQYKHIADKCAKTYRNPYSMGFDRGNDLPPLWDMIFND